jgi:hypothetical protein
MKKPLARHGTAVCAALVGFIVFSAPSERALAQKPSTPVTVDNPATSPVPTTVLNSATTPAVTSSVDDPGRIPYSAQLLVAGCSNGAKICNVMTPSIPSGTRLVIQHVAVEAGLTSTLFVLVEIFQQSATTGAGPLLSAFQVPALGAVSTAPPALGGFVAAGDQAVQIYIDGGNSVDIELRTQLTAPGLDLSKEGFSNPPQVTVTGYLLNCTVNHCAPIAP